eukprot:6478666-Amphidinium_carterae.1
MNHESVPTGMRRTDATKERTSSNTITMHHCALAVDVRNLRSFRSGQRSTAKTDHSFQGCSTLNSSSSWEGEESACWLGVPLATEVLES